MLGELLKCYRRMHDISAKDLALTLKITRASLSRLDQGKTIKSDTLKKVLMWLL